MYAYKAIETEVVPRENFTGRFKITVVTIKIVPFTNAKGNIFLELKLLFLMH